MAEEPAPALCAFRHPELPEDYQCPHAAEFDQPGTGRVCVFHWEPNNDEEKKHKTEAFNERFAKFVEDFEKQGEAEQKQNPLDCRGFVFPAGFSFFARRSVPPTEFTFASFGERARFIGATFGERASFHRATFGERTSFAGATLGKDASFDWAFFGEGVSFDLATFDQGALFLRATFADGASFSHSTFRGHVSFFRATARGALAFRGEPGNPPKRVFHPDPDAAADFEEMHLEVPRRVRFSSVNLRNASFLHTDVSEASFHDVDWPENMLFQGAFNRITLEFDRDTPAALEALERLCQQLKLNYENKRNYAEAGEFHWAEMEYRRRRRRLKKEWLPAGTLWLYRALCGYGERIGRAAAWLAVIFVFTALLQGSLGFYHSPKWIEEQIPEDPKSSFRCARYDLSPYRLLRLVPNRKTVCTDPLPWGEVLGHAGKFALLDLTLQKPEEYSPASPLGRALQPLLRIFFPVQLGLLLVAIRRRFRR